MPILDRKYNNVEITFFATIGFKIDFTEDKVKFYEQFLTANLRLCEIIPDTEKSQIVDLSFPSPPARGRE